MAETWYEKISSTPFPPVNIQALIKQRDKAIILEWEENAKVIPAAKLKNYRIYRKKTGDPGFTAVGIVDSGQFSYRDENIDPEQEYLYALSSINEDNIEGPMSEFVQPIMGDPYPPVNISTNTIINKAFLYHEYINRMTWEGNPQNQGQFTVTKYRIYRKSIGKEDTMFVQIGEVYAPQTEFLDRNLSRQEEADSYIYGVSSVDDDSNESIINKG
jgi:fibronectin type 3 domain-containing protein